MSMLGLEKLHPSPLVSAPASDDPMERVPGQSARPAPTPPHGTLPGRPNIQAMGDRLQLLLGSRFEVLQTVAIGGMATIFQLRHRLHHGLFVAKVLHPELAVRPGVLRSFRTEAIHAARLGAHPNAVPIFDFGELDGLFFMLMPFIEGEDLDQILHRSGPLSRPEVLQLAAQISSLLSHSETVGITHCDITPGNIRLDSFGRYRLLDFGISRSVAQDDQPLAGGTPLYASPEQLQGGRTDIRSDLYSLGTVLAETLTATPLFLGSSMADIKRRHLEGDWTMPTTLEEDDPLAQLLRALLAIEPSSRLQSAFELSGVLDALGHTRPEFRTSLPRRVASTAPDSTRRRLSS